MTESFECLDLSGARNAGPGNVRAADGGWVWPAPASQPERGALADLPEGACRFWGVPFYMGARSAGAFAVCVGSGLPASVSVPVGRRAARLLFAHTCAPLRAPQATFEGDGRQVGAYRITYADGSTVEQPLRRRFEVQDVAVPWGHQPFLCRNCHEFQGVPIDSRAMPWGYVQVGVTKEGPDLQGWWLYDWENPSPQLEIRQVEVLGHGDETLALGGITLCHEPEDPFRWAARQSVAVTVEGEVTPPVEATMERGVVVRQDALLVPGPDYLSTEETGWGCGGQEVRPGQYLEVHGSPRGSLRVRAGETVDETFTWGSVLQETRAERGRVRVELVAPHGRQWVHVRVQDALTRRPLGARIHFRTAQGAYVAPHGHQADVNTGWFEDMGGDVKVKGTPYAYIDGTCQVELPVGEILVEVVRGFEYAPVRQRLQVAPGQRELTLDLRRTYDMAERGWYSGDTHVHFLSTQSAHLEAAAEDVNVVNLLSSQWGRLFTSWKEFTGGLAPTSTPEHQIWVSQENRQHVLGHISLLGLKRMVAPMCSGGPDEAWIGEDVEVLLSDWAAQCREQGGLVVIPHMPQPDFENAATVLLGYADAGELCWIWQGEQISPAERGYYRWLNVGRKLPVVGGTDKMANNRVLGGSRTYARLRDGEPFTYENWCEAVRRGSTFASTGALIDLRVDGRHMGEGLVLPGNGGTVEVQATAQSVWPLTGLQLLCNGQPVACERSASGTRHLSISHRLQVDASCWVAARCWGPHLTDAGPVMAHASPVYVSVGGGSAFVPSDGTYLLTQLEGGAAWARRLGVFRRDEVRDRLLRLFEQASDQLRQRLP